MTDKPFVSVVVPTYNRGKLVRQCVESLFIQDYPIKKYEIIVVNDGSKDNTEQILRELNGITPVKFLWFNQENKGVSAARNLGISKSSGEIICFIDDDCIADQGWLSNIIATYSQSRIGGVGGKLVPIPPESLIERYAHKTFHSITLKN